MYITNLWELVIHITPSGNPFAAYYIDQTDGAEPATLWSDAEVIPETGGTVTMDLSADEDNGGRNYLLFGGVSGNVPGTPLPGGLVTLPVNWDFFTSLVISMANGPIFMDFMGQLDGDGKATATLNLPAIPGSAGLAMTFAYALNDPWDFTSNPINVLITP